MKYFRVGLAILLLALVGCNLPAGVRLPGFLFPATATPPVEPTPSATETPQTAATPQATGGTPVPQSLVLWVPPGFDPAADTPSGKLLKARLAAFSRENGGVQVFVRVKAPSGPGGLLESLSSAAAAAPLAMPSLVALSRPDIETAALKGLIQPLDGLSSLIDGTDWYDYARGLAMVQGATFALPFAGDALLIAYRPAQVIAPPSGIDAIFRLGQPFAFPAADPQALFILSLYESSGGVVEDAQRRPTLQPEVLSQVLSFIDNGENRGIFPYWLSQYETSGQAWQAYQEGRVNVLATWASDYLATLPADTTAIPMTTLSKDPLSLATGWGWAIADPLSERRVLSVKLAEYLSDGAFLATWTEAAGYLPTRPSALAAWTNQSLKTLLGPVATSARARPSVDQLASLGPVLKEATLKVLKRESDPAQAAKAAAEKLAVPESK
jgi:multiple sugar transport system substrate-binding protein